MSSAAEPARPIWKAERPNEVWGIERLELSRGLVLGFYGVGRLRKVNDKIEEAMKWRPVPSPLYKSGHRSPCVNAGELILFRALTLVSLERECKHSHGVR